ncbi:MAG: TonB-dependent receptor plug domain-containing protein [Tannerellaceae bacterium]|nr:TonB-dependent receptor plug domain-containing protein [Tannerellaceae bacterium]
MKLLMSFFDHAHVDMDKKVSLSVTNGDIQTLIQQILPEYTCQIENYKIVILPDNSGKAGEEQRVISGSVTDPEGIPVIGANVVVKGKESGTITDMDGLFTLQVSIGDILIISYIGYISQEIRIDTRRSYSVRLHEDHQTLGEVVVVGYGTQKKVNVVGSIAQISSEELKNRSTPLLSNALTGQMAGITVIQNLGRPGTGSGEIRVRGVGSFGGENNKSDALVLIDGIPGSINDINMEDVETISVLKDASTAAIYGARAANGVILVTTKNGKEGKVSVSYNGYVGFNRPTELPEFVNTWEYATLYNEATGREVYTTEEIQKTKKRI